MSTHSPAVTRAEVDRFDAMARDWWDPAGPMRALHRINPLRLAYLREEAVRHFGLDPEAPFPLTGLRVLDIGCGAGLLSEPIARLGAEVTGLEPAPAALAAARRHAEEGGLAITYRQGVVRDLAAEAGRYDLVVAMEVVEHVPDMRLFLAEAASLVRPGGLMLLATLNRTLRAFALAIVGAEYVLGWLPRGTHDWEKFVTPSELRDALGAAGLAAFGTRGMVFNPLRDAWALSEDVAVNYLARAERPA